MSKFDKVCYSSYGSFQENLESGRYASASDVVRAALRLPAEHEQTRVEQLAALNREVRRRIESADCGEYVTVEEFLQRLREKSAQRRKRKRASHESLGPEQRLTPAYY
jgi:antitoxin ParD1/3/4